MVFASIRLNCATQSEQEEKMAQELAVYNVQKDLERGGLLEG